jgi:hypothetical protein
VTKFLAGVARSGQQHTHDAGCTVKCSHICTFRRGWKDVDKLQVRIFDFVEKYFLENKIVFIMK